MGTPRLRSPRPPQQSRPATPPLPPPPPPPTLSAAASPSLDFSFFPSPLGGHLLLPPLSMSRTHVGRVGSDLSHARTGQSSHHQATTTSYGGKERGRDRASRNKSAGSSPFFSALGSVWRTKDTTATGGGGGGGKGKRNNKGKQPQARRALEVGQWVRRHVASAVEQLRASFSSRQAERQRRGGRPHSFSGHHGPGAARERERWLRRRGQLSSAPASLRVSPANSGHLSVGGSVKVSTSSEESTMEELQSAIEAAIAHCKNSISVPRQTAAAAGDDAKVQ